MKILTDSNGKPYIDENNKTLKISETTLITKSIAENGTYNASDDNVDGYSEVSVNVLPQVTDTVLSLFDCYGNIIAEYTHDEAMSLTEFPKAPEYDGLIFIEYNWTLEQAQEEISKGYNCDVGALYASSDGTF